MKKISTLLALSVLTALSARADLLFEDATNYPYTNGPIEGQGQWYSYSPKTQNFNVFVTNNVVLLTTNSSLDAVATPTNGWVNSTFYTYASFTINVSALPNTPNGGYFAQLQTTNDYYDLCHLFIDTLGTTVPGTYRLGIANYDTSFAGSTPPNNYPLDLATDVTYTVVILYDSSAGQNDPLVGSTLWINPSEADFEAAAEGAPGNYAFAGDTTSSLILPILTTSQIGFSPYINAGISNIVVGTDPTNVISTNLPVIGVQPLPQTNYSGESVTFYTASSGVDLTNQWYGPSGPLVDDGINIIGSQSNILVLTNITGLEQGTYYDSIGDIYGNTVISSNADLTVITTPTVPFFPTNVVVQNLTNNLFQYTGITNIAFGTGPLSYQWYFAPTNTPGVFSPLTGGADVLSGQTGSGLSLYLGDYAAQGQYYVTVSNSLGGVVGPTNTLVELAPLVATMQQIHNYLAGVGTQYLYALTNTLVINPNNLVAGGYVVDYGGTSTTATNIWGGNSWGGYGSYYTEFFIEDASGLGTEVFLNNLGGTNCPPVGSYVTVTGELEVYQGTLEMAPTTTSAIVISNNPPPIALQPRLFNSLFGDISTNVLGSNSITYEASLATLTNVYIYTSASGGALNGKLFSSNSTTSLYCTIGAYSASNTNVWEIFVPTYNYGYYRGVVYATNSCDSNTIPTHCYQVTGVLENYKGTPEILVSRFQDFVTTPPSGYAASVTLTNIPSGHTVLSEANVSWTNQPGSTYSVYTSTNLLAGWTQAAYGLTYYPSNSVFVDTNAAGTAKFYKVLSP